MKKTITWAEFAKLCNDVTVVFRNDDTDDVARAADEFGVDIMNMDTGSVIHFTSSLNETLDVDGSDITIMSEDFAYIITVFDIKPHVFN